MHVEINIVCDDEQEVLHHLSVIRQQFKREVKKVGEITTPVTLEDDNCYGQHTVNIIPECTTEHFPDGNGFCLSCGKPLGVSILVQ